MTTWQVWEEDCHDVGAGDCGSDHIADTAEEAVHEYLEQMDLTDETDKSIQGPRRIAACQAGSTGPLVWYVCHGEFSVDWYARAQTEARTLAPRTEDEDRIPYKRMGPGRAAGWMKRGQR